MGNTGKLEQRIKAQNLRKRGFSYSEILTEVKVSKDTVARWCRDIVLTESQKSELLNKRTLGINKGILASAEMRKAQRTDKIIKIHKEAKKQIAKISKRDVFIAGISLYAAEGHKADGQGGFTNSDPRLICFMSNWLREYAKVDQKDLRGAVWIHSAKRDVQAKKYWAGISGIPIEQFHKTYVSKRDRKIKKNIHINGIFSIRFSRTDIHRKIIGWILALFNDKI